MATSTRVESADIDFDPETARLLQEAVDRGAIVHGPKSRGKKKTLPKSLGKDSDNRPEAPIANVRRVSRDKSLRVMAEFEKMQAEANERWKLTKRNGTGISEQTFQYGCLLAAGDSVRAVAEAFKVNVITVLDHQGRFLAAANASSMAEIKALVAGLTKPEQIRQRLWDHLTALQVERGNPKASKIRATTHREYDRRCRGAMLRDQRRDIAERLRAGLIDHATARAELQAASMEVANLSLYRKPLK